MSVVPEDACLIIRRDSGEILDCNEAAAELLGAQPGDIRGATWSRALACEDGSHTVLGHAVQAGKRISLPPFLIRGAGRTQVAVGGMILPRESDSGATLSLLLWRLLDEQTLGFSTALAPSDTLAVLGVDHLRYDRDWGAPETARLMASIRRSLLQIVRPLDIVGPPSAAAILIMLRDVDIDGARDICRALLSHLHRVHAEPGSLAAGVRICLGLAHRGPEAGPLSTLLAANNALLQAQCGGTSEPIHVADEDDYKLITGRVMNNAGVFSGGIDMPAHEADKDERSEESAPAPAPAPPVAPIEKDIDGYVVDNMEGAVDQAIFLARLDVPVAIIGPAGTGKMYVARVIHEESGAAPDMFASVDCREFRSRSAANARIAKELAQGEGKTLVFKSPQLMNMDAQIKLARQISSRTLADVSPARYLPNMKMIALFPDTLQQLIRKGELSEQLASAFAGYPITVPPIRDRKQAVLRWAHKILGQEGAQRDRDMKGFTPDAERAMLMYDWPGNISEMRQCIDDALEKTDKDWLTPVDLGLFKGIDPEGTPYLPESKPFLASVGAPEVEEEAYSASAGEALNVALGEAVHNMLELNLVKPLGAWLEDDLVLAALDRYRGDMRRAGDFLHTKPRNISRWQPKITAREEERTGSSLWQKPRRLLREWVRETARMEESPLELTQGWLMAHVNEQAAALSSARRASIMGVSTPTYLKRLREMPQG